MKQKFLLLTAWAQREWLAIIIFMVIITMAFLCLVLSSWTLGYWLKALYGYDFELNSCWQGVSAIGAALGLIVALAKAAWTKYDTDSRYNSPIAEPIDKTKIIEKIKEELKK